MKASTHTQGICIQCHKNKQALMRKGVYRLVCCRCHKEKYKICKAGKEYTKHKGDTCILCGFIPVHSCQLDVDHIDGNHNNNDPSNLQTLCANCHRLKTLVCNDTDNKHKKGSSN